MLGKYNIAGQIFCVYVNLNAHVPTNFSKNNYRSRNEFEKSSRSDSNNLILRFKLNDINMIRDNFFLLNV